MHAQALSSLILFLIQATISEVQRVACVAPLSLAHRTLSPTNVEGFTFPTGSVFFANLTSMMKNSNFFPQPEAFKPERFLYSNKKLASNSSTFDLLNNSYRFSKNERVIPFGVGKRYCMGELLARNEVFLFTVSLIQRLQFFPPQEHPTPNPSNYHAGITNIPDDFYVRIEQTFV